MADESQSVIVNQLVRGSSPRHPTKISNKQDKITMPCNSDYMHPNDQEINSKLIANYIIYLSTKLGISIDDAVNKASKEYYGNPGKLNDFTVLLCNIINNLGQCDLDSFVYDGHNKQARELANWWDEHKAVDIKRIADEKNTLAQDEAEYERLKIKLRK